MLLTCFLYVLAVDAFLFRRAGDAGTTTAIATIPLTNLGNQYYTVNVQMGNPGNTQDVAFSIAHTFGYTFVASKCSNCTADTTVPKYNSSASKTYRPLSNTTTTYLYDGKSVSGTLGTEDCALENSQQSFWSYPNQTIFLAGNGTDADFFKAGSGMIGMGQSGVPHPSASFIGNELGMDSSGTFQFAVALNGSDSSPSSSSDGGSTLASYGGVMHIGGTNSSFYSGMLVSMPAATAAQQAGLGTVPTQLGSYDWTVEMQGWTLDTVTDGQTASVSSGQEGIFATFESAYPYIVLPQTDAEKIFSAIPQTQAYTLLANATSASGVSLTQDALVQSWSIPCGISNATLYFNFSGISIPVQSQDLWVPIGGGLCVGNVKGWLDSSRTTAIMGSVFWRGAYIVFSAFNDPDSNTVGIASRNPLLTATSPQAVKHSNRAIIGGAVGGVGFVLLLLAIGYLFILQQRQKWAKKRVAPSAMFINAQRQEDPTLPDSPYQIQAPFPELEREKSIFGGRSGSGVSLGSKYRGKDKDAYLIDPWTPDGPNAAELAGRKRDDSVIVKPWTPSGQNESVSLSPLTIAESSTAASSSLSPMSQPLGAGTISQTHSPVSFVHEKERFNTTPAPYPHLDMSLGVPQNQALSATSHQTHPPSYTTHEESRLPSTTYPTYTQSMRRYSDGRLGVDSRLSDSRSFVSSSTTSATRKKTTLNPVPPPALIGSMATFTTSPTTFSRSAASAVSGSWNQDSPLHPVGRLQTGDRPSRGVRPLPVPGSASTLSITTVASSVRSLPTSTSASGGIRPLPRPPRSDEAAA